MPRRNGSRDPTHEHKEVQKTLPFGNVTVILSIIGPLNFGESGCFYRNASFQFPPSSPSTAKEIPPVAFKKKMDEDV